MILRAAIIDGEVVGGACAVVFIEPASKPTKVCFSFEIECVVSPGDGHFHIVWIAYGQKTQFVFGVETGLVQISLFFANKAAEHPIVLVVIAVPAADPTALDALDCLARGLFPIAVKGRTTDCKEYGK